MKLPKLRRILQWAVIAQPRRGGRSLPVGFAFDDVFLHGIVQVLDEELSWKKKRQTNGEGPQRKLSAERNLSDDHIGTQICDPILSGFSEANVAASVNFSILTV